MNIILTIYSVVIFMSASKTTCKPEPPTKHLTYQNIVIISDMSTRINNKKFPQKDPSEIHKIVQYFKNECVKPGIKIGDRSSISFSVFSEKINPSIDLDKMKNLADKQSFINSTGNYKNCGLENKLLSFEDTVKYVYSKISNPGLDLISLLIEKIENSDMVKKDNVIPGGINTTYINFDNNIYIFTDGYLEYNLSGKRQNNQYYFGALEIERIRKYCLNNGVDIITALNKDKSLGLPISKSNKNQFINLHILETHERDKDTKFLTYSHPRGLRDNEILEAVWRKWAKESGFKNIDWRKY